MTISESSGASTTTASKYVYLFGDGHADGSADMRNLLGGKGANLAEMSGLGIPVPPGFTITTEVCTAFYERGRQYPEGLDAEVRDGVAHIERLLGRRFGDPEPAARLRALGRARLDAGHDGHGPQPRAQRRRRRRAGARDRQRALRLRLLPPLRPDVRRRRARRSSRRRQGSRPVRAHPRHEEAVARRRARHGADGGGAQGARRRVQGRVRERKRIRLPGGPVGAALGRDRRRVRFVGQPARGHLPRA